MKMSLMIGAAALAMTMPIAAMAQMAPSTSTETPTPPATTNDMGAQQMPQGGQMPADPNANMPQGQVPANTGMAPADPSAPMDPNAPVGTSANPVVVGGNTTPAPEARTDYPMCSKTVQDSCMNPSEGKKKMRKRR